jgi:hypothetical protein
MNDRISYRLGVTRGSAILLSAILLLVVGCSGALAPQLSYQGRLTDDTGTPLNGTYQFNFAVYNQASGGTAMYSEADSVAVTDGLFDTVVGPGSVVTGLTPEDLSQPLWLEVAISNGTITETLTPRQRLYGSPYAFTLMPGAVISSTMNTNVFAPNGIKGILSVHNAYDGDPISDPALPALRVIGETGIELVAPSPTDDNGTMFSDQSKTSSDLFLYSNDNMQFYVDRDNNEQGVFAFIGTPGSCQIVAGNLSCSGTKSASVLVQNEQRLLYAIESPEVWFEDFGIGTLKDGQTVVGIDPLFASTIDLEDYHVFLTPLGDCQGLYVANKTPTGFEVRELGGGSANVSFDYRIVAHRLGHEAARLELDTTWQAIEEK